MSQLFSPSSSLLSILSFKLPPQLFRHFWLVILKDILPILPLSINQSFPLLLLMLANHLQF